MALFKVSAGRVASVLIILERSPPLSITSFIKLVMLDRLMLCSINSDLSERSDRSLGTLLRSI